MLLIIIFVSFLAVGGIWARTQSPNYIIWADDFSAGGSENSASASYLLQDTIGEGMILSASSTSASYGLKAGFAEMYPDQYLSLSAGATAVDLDTLTAASTNSGSHTLTVDTNAAKGFTIKVTGNTLTSGVNTIAAIGGTAAASAAGTAQFGINLAANTTPSVGANPSGTAPIASAASQYNTANQFAYQSGDTVASAATDINSTVFTVSYIVNISSSTAAGTYTTTLTYSTTANF
ncbi:MAG: hypothetical protein WC768_00270 [Patescibacteria group bacterium]